MKKNQPGKNVVLLTAFVLSLAAFILLMVAYVTPYWVISWPRVYSEFRKIGMWEACFGGLVLDWDSSQKAYHGCWWILAKEFAPIRDWMMPPWFVTTQILTTICALVELVGVVILGNMYSRASTPNAMGQVGQIRQPFVLVQAATYINISMALTMTFTIMMFASFFNWDKNWMPRKDLNYLSMSYGLAVLSAFFSIFASIAIVIYNRLIRVEYRAVHQPAALDLSHLGPSKS